MPAYGRCQADSQSLKNAVRAAIHVSASIGTFTYVKIVVDASMTEAYLADLVGRALEAVTGGAGPFGLAIQSVTGRGAPPIDHLLRLYDAVRPLYADVRVVPQPHKTIGAP